MTERVNGLPEQGEWFERQVTWLEVTAAANLDFGLGQNVEQIKNLLQTRGVILAMNQGAAADELCVLIGHAGGAFENDLGTPAKNVISELEASALITSITKGSGFLVKP